MATRTINVAGGRTSGSSSYTPVSPTTQGAQLFDETLTRELEGYDPQTGAAPAGTATAQQASNSLGFNLPTLDGIAVDALFARQAENAAFNAAVGAGESGGSYDPAQDPLSSTTKLVAPYSSGLHARQFKNLYDQMGWDLGWNKTSGVIRGPEALGYAAGHKITDVDQATQMAKALGLDAGNSTEALLSTVNDALKNFYLVRGDSGTLPGQTDSEGSKHLQALYYRKDDKLNPLGNVNTYDAPENSRGFIKEAWEGLAPAIGVLLAPFTMGGAGGLLGATGSLTTGLASATGMSAAAANMLIQAGISGSMAGLSGGNALRGALTGAIGAGVSPMIPQIAQNIAGGPGGMANLLTGAGRLGLSSALSGGRISPISAVGTLLSSYGRPNQPARAR